MEHYTDDERAEDIKKWWLENGSSIMIGIGLGLVAIFGWQYWNGYRNSQAEQASQAYDAFVIATEKPDQDQARQRGQVLLDEFPKSPYAALTALQLAKVALEGGNTASAIQWLEWVIDKAPLDELKDIARIRLARVLLATGRLAEVEAQLTRVTTARLAAEREELRGDMALISNDAAKARTAYTAAKAAQDNNPLLQLKLDHLALPSAESTLIPAPAVPATVPTPEPAAPAQSGAATDAKEAASATPSAAPAEAAPISPPAAVAEQPAPAATVPVPAAAPASPAVIAPAAESIPAPPPAVIPPDPAPVTQPAPSSDAVPPQQPAAPPTSDAGTAPVPAANPNPTSGQ